MKKNTIIIIVAVALAILLAVGIVIAVSMRNRPTEGGDTSTVEINGTTDAPGTGEVEPATDTDTEPVATTEVPGTTVPETDPIETGTTGTVPPETEPKTEPITTTTEPETEPQTEPITTTEAGTTEAETKPITTEPVVTTSAVTEPIVTPCSHKYVETVTKAATCTAAGEKKLTCSKCGDTKTETIAKLGHNFGAYAVTKAATCTAAGEKVATCSRCSAQDKKTIAALGHSYSGSVVTVEASCASAGQSTSTCTRCGSTVVETIPKYEHSYVEHTITPATCKANGVVSVDCQYCGHHLENRPLTGGNHAFGEAVVTKEPTATETGIVTYTCSICGETITSSLPTVGTPRCCKEENDMHEYRYHSKSKYLYSYVYVDCKGNYNNYSYEVWHCDKCGCDYKRPYSKQYVPLPPTPQHNFVKTNHIDGVRVYENGYHYLDAIGTDNPTTLRYDVVSIDEYTCTGCESTNLVITGSNGCVHETNPNKLSNGGANIESFLSASNGRLWEYLTDTAPAFGWKTASWSNYETIREGNDVDIGKIERKTCTETGDVWYRITSIDGGYTIESPNLYEWHFHENVHFYRVSDTYMGRTSVYVFDERSNVTIDMVPSIKVDIRPGQDYPITVYWKDKAGKVNEYTWLWYDDGSHTSVLSLMSVYIYHAKVTASNGHSACGLPQNEDGTRMTWS